MQPGEYLRRQAEVAPRRQDDAPPPALCLPASLAAVEAPGCVEHQTVAAVGPFPVDGDVARLRVIPEDPAGGDVRNLVESERVASWFIA